MDGYVLQRVIMEESLSPSFLTFQRIFDHSRLQTTAKAHLFACNRVTLSRRHAGEHCPARVLK